MPWVDQQWFKQIATSLQHLDSKFDKLLKQETTMSQATDNLAAAVQRVAGVDQQILAQMHDLVTQNASLANQIKQTSDDPQVQALADQLNANTDQLAAVIITQAQQPAQSAPSAEPIPDAPAGQ